jgi:hypothetical protein
MLNRGAFQLRLKADGLAAGPDSKSIDLRQIQLVPAHPKPVQANLLNREIELATLRRKYVDLASLNGTRTKQRIFDPYPSSPKHFNTPAIFLMPDQIVRT